MAYDCMEDCIHLHACRRLQAIAKKRFSGLHIARNCTEDCSAYESFDGFLLSGEREEEVQGLINRIAVTVGGSSAYGEYIITDFIR